MSSKIIIPFKSSYKLSTEMKSCRALRYGSYLFEEGSPNLIIEPVKTTIQNLKDLARHTIDKIIETSPEILKGPIGFTNNFPSTLPKYLLINEIPYTLKPIRNKGLKAFIDASNHRIEFMLNTTSE